MPEYMLACEKIPGILKQIFQIQFINIFIKKLEILIPKSPIDLYIHVSSDASEYVKRDIIRMKK